MSAPRSPKGSSGAARPGARHPVGAERGDSSRARHGGRRKARSPAVRGRPRRGSSSATFSSSTAFSSPAISASASASTVTPRLSISASAAASISRRITERRSRIVELLLDRGQIGNAEMRRHLGDCRIGSRPMPPRAPAARGQAPRAAPGGHPLVFDQPCPVVTIIDRRQPAMADPPVVSPSRAARVSMRVEKPSMSAIIFDSRSRRSASSFKRRHEARAPDRQARPPEAVRASRRSRRTSSPKGRQPSAPPNRSLASAIASMSRRRRASSARGLRQGLVALDLAARLVGARQAGRQHERKRGIAGHALSDAERASARRCPAAARSASASLPPLARSEAPAAAS